MGLISSRKLKGSGLPDWVFRGHVATRIRVREAVGKEMTRTWHCNDIIKQLYLQKLHRECMRASIASM
jgi:hypothetical protein